MENQANVNDANCCIKPKKSICWGSILAGTVVTLAAQVCFSILGVAIGMSTIDPLVEANPTQGIAMGSAIWWIVSGTISLFIGGWIAGKVSGSYPENNKTHCLPCRGSLHGFVTWTLVTVLSVWLVTSAMGKAATGVLGALGTGIGILGNAASAAAPEVKNASEEFMKKNGIEIPNLDVSNLKMKAKAMMREVPNAQEGSEDFSNLFDRLYARADQPMSVENKDAFIDYIARRNNVSREEAAKMVGEWEQAYNQVKAKFEEAKKVAEQKTREASDKAASATSQASFALFFILILGALSTILGGRCGSNCNRDCLPITK